MSKPVKNEEDLFFGLHGRVIAERVLEGLYTNMKHYAARAVRDQLRHSEKFQAVERARQTLDGHLRLVIRDIESEFPGLDFADEYW